MPEFDVALQYLILAGVGIGIALAAGFGIKLLLRKPAVDREGGDRLAGIESRLSEIEERLDFSERMLTDLKGRAQFFRLGTRHECLATGLQERSGAVYPGSPPVGG